MRSRRYPMLLARCLPLVTSPAGGEEGDPTFRLKADETRLGSNIKRETERSGSVPLDKNYGEMTAGQRAVIRSG